MVELNFSAVTVISSRPVASLVDVEVAAQAVPHIVAVKQLQSHVDNDRRLFDPIIPESPLLCCWDIAARSVPEGSMQRFRLVLCNIANA
jgi:hypothetical protein